MSDTIPPLTEKDAESKDLVAENIGKLKQLFPEIVTDGKVDFETLQEVLGDFKEDSQERYSFTWNGKSKARKLAMTPSRGTLRPAPDESVNWDSAENLFIEGDNLEVLKLLQRSYHGKVKVIYIDPPYNTGKDFVYKDNFKENISNYLKLTEQKADSGEVLSSNPETHGKYHTNWLNMIYPRLKLASELLSQDGVIFISIDDHEQYHMRLMCNEIFGEENFIACIANINNPKGRSDDKYIATSHEYLLVYAKDENFFKARGFDPGDKIIKRYNKEDQEGNLYREIDLRKTGDNDLREDRPNLFYYFYYNEETGDFYPSYEDKVVKGYQKIFPQRADGKEGNWRWELNTSNERLDKLIPKFMPNREVWGVMEKDYLKDRGLVTPTSSWNFKDVNSERGSEAFINLGFDKRVFPKPKPVGTIKRVCKIGSEPNVKDIILDFYAGSGTTAQAVFEQNLEDNGDRRFILIQLPEPCDEKDYPKKVGFNNIAEISKERIRRAAAKSQETDTNTQSDFGFKVYKLDKSNLKPWDPTFDEVQLSIEDSIENIKPDRSEQDVLYEILLKYGLDLSLRIEEKEIAGSKVFLAGAGALFICLAPNIDLDVVEGIAKLKEELEPELTRVVFRDSGFKDDVVKTNAVQILKQHGIEDVRSI